MRTGLYKPRRYAERAADDARLGEDSGIRRVPYGDAYDPGNREGEGYYLSVIEDEAARWPAPIYLDDKEEGEERRSEAETDVYVMEGDEDGAWGYPDNSVPRRGWGESLVEAFGWYEWDVWRVAAWRKKAVGLAMVGGQIFAFVVVVRVVLAAAGVAPLDREFGNVGGPELVKSTWEWVLQLAAILREEIQVGRGLGWSYLVSVMGSWTKIFARGWVTFLDAITGDLGAIRWLSSLFFVIGSILYMLRLCYHGLLAP